MRRDSTASPELAIRDAFKTINPPNGRSHALLNPRLGLRGPRGLVYAARVTTPALDALMADLRLQFPRLRVIDKRADAFSRLLDVLVRVATLGGNSAYMTRYVTTLGQTIYLPATWSERSETARVIVMRHEAVHLAQFRRYGRLGMTLIYLFPILPLGLALGRARIEWEAYAETLRATAELEGRDAAHASSLREHIVAQFVGPAYGYMWPFPRTVGRWIDAELGHIDARSTAPDMSVG